MAAHDCGSPLSIPRRASGLDIAASDGHGVQQGGPPGALPRILVQQPVRQMLAHLPIYALLPSSEQCASRRAFDDVGVPKSRLMAPLRPGKTRNTSASMDGNETPHLFPVSADLLFLYVYVGDQQVAEWYRVPVVHVDM